MDTKTDNIESVYPLSHMQKGMLFLDLRAPGSGVNTEQIICGLHDNLNVSALRQAWQRVVARHAVLRTSLHWVGYGKPVQKVHRQVRIPWEIVDWRGLPEEGRESRFTEFLQTDCRRGFNISQAPLARWVLFRLKDDDYRLVWSFSHMILDGRSFTQLIIEVFTLYEALLQDDEIKFKEPRSYEDYIQWLRKLDLAGAKDFWQEQLKGFTAPTALCPQRCDMGRNGDKTACGGIADRIDPETTRTLMDLASQNHITLNTIVQGAWALLLSRYSREEDVVFGAVRACRKSSIDGADAIVGLFINTLPMRVRIQADLDLISWLREIRAQHVRLREYEHSPLIEVQKWSDVPPATPLFESIIVFENYDLNTKLRSQGEKWRQLDFQLRELTKYPITLYVYAGKALKLKIGYQEGRCDKDTAARMLGHLQTLLEKIAAQPHRRLSELTFLTKADQKQLLEWNATDRPFPENATVHRLFETQVERTPDAVALVYDDRQLTYRQLNARANQLANSLRRVGVGPDVMVGICVERSMEMIVALLGILKAGGAYVPLDPTYPPERLAYMMSDSRAPVVVLQERFLNLLPEPDSQVVVLDRDPNRFAKEAEDNIQSGVKAEHLAYVIYTSGSTGKPKGVMIEHRNVVNFFIGMDACIEHDPGSTWLAVTSPSFDISVLEIFWTLARGFRVVIYGQESDPGAHSIPELIALHDVSHFQCTPSMASMLMLDKAAPDAFGRLKQFLIGGEAFPAKLARQLQKVVGGDIINMYGPTETTIWSTTYKLNGDHQSIPIGRPIANTEIRILNENLQPVPIGVPGELMIGGAGVVRGYLNRPNLTAERFIEHPFFNDSDRRLYRTGDLARFLPDGNIEFLGRLDHQVKILGYRIELGEIEAVLNDYPAVYETVVIAREDVPGQRMLVAYVIPRKGENFGRSELRNYAKEKLPGYMVPAHVVMLEAFPQTPNKKIDRKALPSPDMDRFEREAGFDPPRTDIEAAVAEIWAEALFIRQVGRNENFFDLGGDSLSACGVILSIQGACKVDLPLQIIFNAPTVATMANKLEEAFLEQVEAVQPRPASPQFSPQDNPASIGLSIQSPPEEECFEAPKTQTEKTLAAIWAKTLQINRIGRNDNFFHLGGKSLQALIVFTEIEEVFGKKLPISTLLQAPTLEQLANVLEENERVSEWSSLVPIQTEGSQPPLFLVHGAEGNVLFYRDLARYLGADQPVYALQSQGLDGNGKIFTELEGMASHYVSEIRELQPKGPYYLGGYCLGGTIALEMAHQLRAQDEQVDLVAMVETYNVCGIPANESWLVSIFHALQNVHYHLGNFLSIGSSDRWKFLSEKWKVEKGRFGIRLAAWSNSLKRARKSSGSRSFPHMKVKKVNEQATYDYVPKAYPGTVAVFRPKVHFLGQNDPGFGWGEVIQEGLFVNQLPVYPKGIMVEPFVQILAEELKIYLEGARTSKRVKG